MKNLAIFLISFGILIIIFPEFLAILIGSFFVVIGLSLLFTSLQFKKASKKDYVKFGKYKIYR